MIRQRNYNSSSTLPWLSMFSLDIFKSAVPSRIDFKNWVRDSCLVAPELVEVKKPSPISQRVNRNVPSYLTGFTDPAGKTRTLVFSPKPKILATFPSSSRWAANSSFAKYWLAMTFHNSGTFLSLVRSKSVVWSCV